MRTKSENNRTPWNTGKRERLSRVCFLVFNLIGSEGDAGFLDQSQSEIK